MQSLLLSASLAALPKRHFAEQEESTLFCGHHRGP
jgi:hypothetical protein